MKQLIKTILARTPYRITRRVPTNRFQAIDESLASLAARGFSPGAVIDGGAHTGAFTRTVLNLFSHAIVHAIEPQPGCQAALEALRASANGRVVLHPIALCAPEDEGASLCMAMDAATASTGAHITQENNGLAVPSQTLDRALASHAASLESALLKLDLQGYELHALRGAVQTLKTVSVVLTEVSFYAQAYEPPISRLVSFLGDHGFELYDVASIYARPRDDRPRQGDFVFVRTDAIIAKDKAWS
jgi:FkbM family methyltransferase